MTSCAAWAIGRTPVAMRPTCASRPRTIIGIGQDPSMLGNTYPLDIAVWGNVRHTLSALNASWKDADCRQPHLERRRTDVRTRGEQRIRKLHDEAAGLATDRPIHPNYVAHVAGGPAGHHDVSESFRNADHLMPFGLDKNQWRLVRTFGASLGYGIGAAVGAQLGAPDRPVRVQPRRRRRDVQRLRLLDHGPLWPADPDPHLEQPELPDGAHELPHLRRRDGQAEEIPRGLPGRARDRLRDAREGAGDPGSGRCASPRTWRPRCGGVSTPSRRASRTCSTSASPRWARAPSPPGTSASSSAARHTKREGTT